MAKQEQQDQVGRAARRRAFVDGLPVATLLDSAGVVELHQLAQPILLGGLAIWLGIADLRTRFNR